MSKLTYTQKNWLAALLAITFPIWIVPFVIAVGFAHIFNGIREEL